MVNHHDGTIGIRDHDLFDTRLILDLFGETEVLIDGSRGHNGKVGMVVP
jgi:hypothetical protein